jgi:hypothetical protein
MGPHHSSVCTVTVGLGAAQVSEAIMGFLREGDVYFVVYRNFIEFIHVCPPFVDFFSVLYSLILDFVRVDLQF